MAEQEYEELVGLEREGWDKKPCPSCCIRAIRVELVVCEECYEEMLNEA